MPDHLRLLLSREPPRPHATFRRRVGMAVVLVGLVDVAGTLLMWWLEDDVHRSEIHNLWDAFFYSTLQLLTVSSAMQNPVTTGGQIVDIGLALTGVGLVSGIAGAFASFFLNVDRDTQATAG
jgi:hypothetical protein